MFNCPHTGVALAPMITAYQGRKIESPITGRDLHGHGLKFTDFKVDYHKEKLDSQHVRQQAHRAATTVSAVKKALEETLKEEENDQWLRNHPIRRN